MNRKAAVCGRIVAKEARDMAQIEGRKLRIMLGINSALALFPYRKGDSTDRFEFESVNPI